MANTKIYIKPLSQKQQVKKTASADRSYVDKTLVNRYVAAMSMLTKIKQREIESIKAVTQQLLEANH